MVTSSLVNRATYVVLARGDRLELGFGSAKERSRSSNEAVLLPKGGMVARVRNLPLQDLPLRCRHQHSFRCVLSTVESIRICSRGFGLERSAILVSYVGLLGWRGPFNECKQVFVGLWDDGCLVDCVIRADAHELLEFFG